MLCIRVRLVLRRHIAAALVAVKARVVEVDVKVLVIVIVFILRLNNAFTDVDIQRVEGDNQLEKLVAAGAHRRNLRNLRIILIHRHEACDIALHLYLHQDIRVRKAVLRAGVLVGAV